MKKNIVLLVMTMLSAAIANAQPQGITITVIPALAPNAYGSPNWNAWVSNATTAILNGYASYGDPSSPSYYQQAPGVIPVAKNMVTSFPSWNGFADPGNVFGPNFAQESGNRIQFGIDIKGGTNLISISHLSFIAHSTDTNNTPIPNAGGVTNNTLDFTFAAGSYNYGPSYIGIIYGPGGGNTFITSGSPTQLVNEIVGRGSGNAWWPDGTSADSIATQQSNIVLNATMLDHRPIAFSGTYTIDGVSASNSVMFSSAATPASGGITTAVFPALAPNRWGSPSWNAWASNAVTAILNGNSSYGDSSLPSYYRQVTNAVPVTNNMVTSFPSWMGVADPGSVFGPSFSQESGNRLTFGMDIKGGTNLISIAQLSFIMTSTDPGNTLNWSYSPIPYSYSGLNTGSANPVYLGIIYGPDGQNIYVTNGPPTQLVNEIVTCGSGNAWWPDGTSADSIATQQSNIVLCASQTGSQLFFFTGTYIIDGVTASNSVTFNPAPPVYVDPRTRGVTTITVIPALAPNANSSPSWNAWVSNAVTAILNGDSTYGDPALPSYYQQVTNAISVTNNIVTGFPSWNGLADPGTAYGANYSAESGNRIHFGFDIKGGTNLISIAQLSFVAHSTDANNTLDLSYLAGAYNYNPSYVGIIYGPNNTDTYITSGSPTQRVNEIVGRGSGNAWQSATTGMPDIACEQSNINVRATQICSQSFVLIGTYTLAGVSGLGQVTFTPALTNGTPTFTGSDSPMLTITRTNSVLVAWPAVTGFVLQTNIDLLTTNWGDYTGSVNSIGGTNQVIFSTHSRCLFFRLKH